MGLLLFVVGTVVSLVMFAVASALGEDAEEHPGRRRLIAVAWTVGAIALVAAVVGLFRLLYSFFSWLGFI